MASRRQRGGLQSSASSPLGVGGGDASYGIATTNRVREGSSTAGGGGMWAPMTTTTTQLPREIDFPSLSEVFGSSPRDIIPPVAETVSVEKHHSPRPQIGSQPGNISNRHRKKGPSEEVRSASSREETAPLQSLLSKPIERFQMTPVRNDRVRINLREVTLGKEQFTLVSRMINGIDDAVYTKCGDVWENVPRGHCVVSVRTTASDVPVGEMFGLRKFGYRDSSYGCRRDVRFAEALTKENGECAHLAAFTYNSQRYWLPGSKNVTLIIRDTHMTSDLKMWEETAARAMCVRIASMMIAKLTSLEPTARLRLHETLAANDWTANAEAIFSDSQHIVDYNGTNELRFYAISGPGPSDRCGLCALSPKASKELFESCGLSTVSRFTPVPYPSREWDEQVSVIARQENSEGVVVYGYDEANRVVCMWKEKSYPYVMERIAREAITSGKVGEELRKYLQFRLSRQDATLRAHFSDWEQHRLPFLIRFAAWLREKNVLRQKTSWEVRSDWLNLQKQCKAVDSTNLDRMVQKYLTCVSPHGSCVTIVLCGPPGSGKSTIARALFAMLRKANQYPRWLNQDEAGGKNATFLKALKAAAEDPKSTHLLIDKTNLAATNRKDYTNLALVPALTLLFKHPEGDAALSELCLRRVANRATGHRTLRITTEDSESHAKNLIDNFIHNADWPDDPSCIELDISRSAQDTLQSAYEAVRSVTCATLPEYDTLSADECIGLSNEYERLLTRLRGASPRLASIKVLHPEKLAQLIPSSDESLSSLVPITAKGDCHVTIKFFGDEMDPVLFVTHGRLLGQEVEIHVSELVWDSCAAAFVVDGNFQSTNPVAHITWATALKVKPAYSNTLLQKRSGVKRLRLDATILGKFGFD